MARLPGSLFGREEVDPSGLGPGSVGLHTPEFQIPQLQNAPTQPTTPLKGTLFSGNTGKVLSGLQAGQTAPAGEDVQSSLLSGLFATGAGALAGGPVGAAVGGISSLINSFLSVSKKNKRKREMKRLVKEMEAKREKARVLAQRDKAQGRSDQLLQLKFNRKDTERNQAINAFSTKRQLLFNAINANPLLKQRFIKTGVR